MRVVKLCKVLELKSGFEFLSMTTNCSSVDHLFNSDQCLFVPLEVEG